MAEEIKDKSVLVFYNVDEIKDNKEIILYLKEIEIKGERIAEPRHFGLFENMYITGRMPNETEKDNPADVNFRIETKDMTMSRKQAIIHVKKQINGDYVMLLSSFKDKNKNMFIVGDKIDGTEGRFPLEEIPIQLYEGDEFVLGSTRFSVHFKKYS